MPLLTTGLALLRDASSPTCWLIRFPCSLLLRSARWSSFDRSLNWGHTTRSPHILSINWCYDWFIASLVCRDMVTWVNILLRILFVEKYAGDCMSTGYDTYIPLPTTAMCYGQVNNETLQTTFYFKLGLPAQQANHLLITTFSLCNLFRTLAQISNSTLKIFFLLS